MGVGVAILKLSIMGNDPHTAMVMGLEGKTGIQLIYVLVAVQCIWFIAEIIFGKEKVGPGIFANWFGVRFVITWTLNFVNKYIKLSGTIYSRGVLLLVGIIVLSLSVSLYQTADMGISPYDSISLIMSERLLLPYFWCRIITDVFCVVVAFLSGGIVGIGTLICALGLGPFVAFFNRHVSEKLFVSDSK